MTTALLTPPTKLAAAGRAIGDPGQVSALLPTAAGEFVLYGSPEQNPLCRWIVDFGGDLTGAREVVDGTGRTVVIPADPQRILPTRRRHGDDPDQPQRIAVLTPNPVMDALLALGVPPVQVGPWTFTAEFLGARCPAPVAGEGTGRPRSATRAGDHGQRHDPRLRPPARPPRPRSRRAAA